MAGHSDPRQISFYVTYLLLDDMIELGLSFMETCKQQQWISQDLSSADITYVDEVRDEVCRLMSRYNIPSWVVDQERKICTKLNLVHRQSGIRVTLLSQRGSGTGNTSTANGIHTNTKTERLLEHLGA